MTNKTRSILVAVVAAGFMLAAGSALAGAEFKVPGSSEGSVIKLGIMAQGQYEYLSTHDYDHDEFNTNQNLFFRRLRILMGGNLTPNLSFFVETDSPNLGKYDPKTGTKNAGDMYVQDAFFTYSFGDEFKIDGGMLLTANSHNSNTSAATLLAIDYGPYSFLHSAPTDSRVGRDYGVEARGYLIDKHLEYRVGVFQGRRDLDYPHDSASGAMRYIGRVVYYFFEPETSYFYTGTTLGKKQILAIGGGVDAQDEYVAYNGDIFWDQPLGNGDAVTIQADYIWYDGNDTFTSLPGQSVWLFEGQYYFSKAKLGLFGQYAVNDYAGWYSPTSSSQDEVRYQAGLAYYPDGHNFSLKLGYGYQDTENRLDTMSWVLQCEVFNY